MISFTGSAGAAKVIACKAANISSGWRSSWVAPTR